MTIRQTDLLGKVRAAAAAGFPAIGATVNDYLDARRSGTSDRELRAQIDAEGIEVAELESPWDWASAPDAGPVEDDVFRAADMLGCSQINVVQFVPHPDDEVRAGLERIVRRAERTGVRIALEFMPFSELPTLAEAARVVRDLPVGLILDLWHLVRSGGTVADVAALRPDSIESIQLNGVAALPLRDVRHEARHHRMLPDEGALDVGAVLAELRRQGVDARLSVEVWSDGLFALEPVAAAQRVFDATQRVLAAAELQAEVI